MVPSFGYLAMISPVPGTTILHRYITFLIKKALHRSLLWNIHLRDSKQVELIIENKEQVEWILEMMVRLNNCVNN